MRNLVIIRASESDASRVAPLFDAYRKFYRQRSNLPAAKRFVERRLAKNESVIFLALRDGSPVGFVQLYPSFSSVSMKPLWILNDLYVVPEARKSGVASALLRKSERLARGTKSKELVLETSRNNLKARRLYERLGWKLDKSFLTYRLKTG